jgi:hypothetical protein
MRMPEKPATPVDDDAPPLPGDVWMEPAEDAEEIDSDEEVTRPGGPVIGVDDREFEDKDEPS